MFKIKGKDNYQLICSHTQYVITNVEFKKEKMKDKKNPEQEEILKVPLPYESPEIEVIEVVVEEGFALSFERPPGGGDI